MASHYLPGNTSLSWSSFATLVWRIVSEAFFNHLKKHLVHRRVRTMFSEKTDQFQSNYSHEHRDWIMLRENVILLTWDPPVTDSRGRSHSANTDRLTERATGRVCVLCFKHVMRGKLSHGFWLICERVKKRAEPAAMQQEGGELRHERFTVTCPVVRSIRRVSVL